MEEARPKAWLSTPSDLCLQRLVGPVPTVKRSVTHAKTRPVICHKPWELDIKARLEKQILTRNWLMPGFMSQQCINFKSRMRIQELVDDQSLIIRRLRG